VLGFKLDKLAIGVATVTTLPLMVTAKLRSGAPFDRGAGKLTTTVVSMALTSTAADGAPGAAAPANTVALVEYGPHPPAFCACRDTNAVVAAGRVNEVVQAWVKSKLCSCMPVVPSTRSCPLQTCALSTALGTTQVTVIVVPDTKKDGGVMAGGGGGVTGCTILGPKPEMVDEGYRAATRTYTFTEVEGTW